MSSATVFAHQGPKKEICRSSALGVPSGIDIGGCGLEQIMFAGAGSLARRWWLWCGASLVEFGIATRIAVAALTEHVASRPWQIAGDAAFVLACAASSFAFLVLFARFGRKVNPVDSFSGNACGLYLVHFAFAGWLQLSLLTGNLSTIEKGSLVFVGASLLSWGTAAVLRRISPGHISQWTA